MSDHSNRQRRPLLGCIADDVTGATDLSTNLVQGGMKVKQFLRVPDDHDLRQAADADAWVVALKTRSVPAAEAVDQSLLAAKRLRTRGIERFFFKYCSTFDSTAEGNIGPVAEALAHWLDVPLTLFCPAFPNAGRTVYRGHLFVGDRLLHQSGMENHPLNPMTDANLVRWLGLQTTKKVGLLSHPSGDGEDSLPDRLRHLTADGFGMAITDACDNDQLRHLASLSASQRLVTGGSGIARYLPDAYREDEQLTSSPFVPEWPTVEGRGLILAGSCSLATRAQVEWMRNRCPSRPINVARLMCDPDAEQAEVLQWASESPSDAPLMIYSSSDPNRVAADQSKFGSQRLAESLERFQGRIGQRMVDDFGFRRLVLAGGETSGAVVRELGVGSLDIGPEICTGVPWTSTDTPTRLALALKSGNFGDERFFETALERLS